MGRLIGPKTWDRSVGIFLENVRGRFCTAVGRGCLVSLCVYLCIKCCLVCVGPGYGRGLRVH